MKAPTHQCVWCDKEKSIFSIFAKCDSEGKASAFLCNDCILILAGMFFRGRHEFPLAQMIEKFIGHKLPFEMEEGNEGG